MPPLLVLSLTVRRPGADRGGAGGRLAGDIWGAVLWQSIGNTMFGYAAWGWLLGRYPAATIAPLSLLVPVFGMGTAAWWLRRAAARVEACQRRRWSSAGWRSTCCGRSCCAAWVPRTGRVSRRNSHAWTVATRCGPARYDRCASRPDAATRSLTYGDHTNATSPRRDGGGHRRREPAPVPQQLAPTRIPALTVAAASRDPRREQRCRVAASRWRGEPQRPSAARGRLCGSDRGVAQPASYSSGEIQQLVDRRCTQDAW